MPNAPSPSVSPSPSPKVSVVMLTYNHEKFIAQAIESVLIQRTNFPIELVVGEDCSTDGTREIVRRYAAARPDIIRLVFHEKNVGAYENGQDVLAACQGEYIALLEGDDYWTSPDKLQRQADYLDAQPACALCFHRRKNSKFANANPFTPCAITSTTMWKYPRARLSTAGHCWGRFRRGSGS